MKKLSVMAATLGASLLALSSISGASSSQITTQEDDLSWARVASTMEWVGSSSEPSATPVWTPPATMTTEVDFNVNPRTLENYGVVTVVAEPLVYTTEMNTGYVVHTDFPIVLRLNADYRVLVCSGGEWGSNAVIPASSLDKVPGNVDKLIKDGACKVQQANS